MQERHRAPLNASLKRLPLLLLVLLSVPGGQGLSWSLRSLPCEISTSNQSQTFTCSDRKLREVPRGIGWNATWLDLSFNKIQKLSRDSFLNLHRLTLLDLKFNRISAKHRHKTPMQIDPFTFSELRRLNVLLLDGNGLAAVPQHLPVDLSSLSLSHNNIRMLSPENFSDITNLRSIRLQDNCYGSACTGALTIMNHTFAHLTDLTNLTLSQNRLEAIPPFLPPSLLALKLKLNAISHICQNDLNYLVNLRVLDMSGNCPVCANTPFPCVPCKTSRGQLQIHPEAFRALSKLQELRLSGNSLQSIPISWFQNLTSLQYLYLSFNSLIREISVGEFPSVLPLVEVMDLSYNSDLSHSHTLGISENFSMMASLETLHLEGCYLVFAPHEEPLKPLYDLPNLSVINLGTNFLQSVDLTLFARFNNLSVIDLSVNSLSFLSPSPPVCGSGYNAYPDRHHFGPYIHTDKLYRRFPPSIKPECRVYGPALDLSRNSIITINPKQLHGLENITCLNLSTNSINEMLNGSEFGHFPKLKYLDLTHNKIDLCSDLAFSELKELEVLDLSHNSNYFVLAGLNHSLMFLQHLSCLKSLNLSWNEIYTLTNKSMSSGSLQELVFQGNRLDLMWNGDIQEWFFNLFEGLRNLTYLDLSLNKLENIPSKVYFPPTLRHLDLSRNTLRAFEWKMLKPLRRLEKLDLSENHLYFVTNHLFTETSSLRLLDLSHNRISVLTPGFLRDASNLWFLDLSFNLVTLLNRTTFESGVENHLRHLSLKGNPLHCTCDLFDFHLWMMDNNVELPLLATAVTCDFPDEQRGQSVLNVNIEACIRDEKAFFIATSLPVLLILLMTLTAHLFYWDLSYMLEYCGAKLKYRRSQTTSCVYDAFVMYDTADPVVSEWVLTRLRMELEERGEKICLCLEERDWAPGASIMENLSHSVRHSKKTVFVMTEGFLSRGVAKMAALLVHQRLVDEGLDVMVLLLLEPTVLRRSRILRLRRRLCERSVVEWPPGPTTGPAARQWFWCRLRRAVREERSGTHTGLHGAYFTEC